MACTFSQYGGEQIKATFEAGIDRIFDSPHEAFKNFSEGLLIRDTERC